MDEDELVRRILDEADMAARPGQYDRLVAIANEVAALREELERTPDGWEVVVAEKKGRREVLADLRAEVLGLEHGDECVTRWQPRDLRRKKRPCDCLIADVITKIEEAGR